MTGGLRRILTYTVLLSIFFVISTNGVMADGTEQLGDPSITIAQGSGIVANGAGLLSGTGTIKIDVPIGTTVKQVLLYWEGQQHYPGNGDDSIIVNSNHITGTLIGGPTLFFSDVYSSTYRADITSLGLIIPGPNILSVSGLAFDYASNGAGILVIYDDGTNANIILKDGNDLAYAGIWAVPGFFLPPLDTTVEQEFIFTPENYDRTAKITMFFSSVSGTMSQFGFRPSAINITIGSTTTQIIDQLDSKNGQEWDTLIADVTIPAQATSLKVQALSVDMSGGETGDPASFAWNAAALSLPLPASIGDRVWIDANNNGIQDAGETGYSGATVSLQTCAGAAMGTTTTDTNGIYSFTGLLPGSYKVIFTLPSGNAFSPMDANVNVDDAVDSDADTITGITACTDLAPGENDPTWDAGIYKQMSPGTGTPGYWKNHPEAWPMDTIMIGGITYTKAQAIAIMELSVNGDKTYTMFPALVSAKLNVMIGNDASCIADTISAADAWMKLHHVGSGVAGSSQAWKDGEPLYIKMDNYNKDSSAHPTEIKKCN